jgi:acyl carrier protein
MSATDRYRKIAELGNIDQIMQAAAVTRQRADLDFSTLYVPPSSATEVRLAAIWKEVLGLDEVGVTDNFFELDGDSLHIIQVLNRIWKTFCVDLPVDRFFEGPTVRELAVVTDLAQVPDRDCDITRDLDLVEQMSNNSNRDDPDGH